MTVPSMSCETSEPFLVAYTIPVSDSRFRLLKKRSVGAYTSSYLCGSLSTPCGPIHCSESIVVRCDAQ